MYIHFENEKKDSKEFTIYFFVNSYEKEVDGIYTSHKEINLNISDIVRLIDLTKNIDNYNCENDLKGHIIFKNFKSEKISADEPIIVEIKSGFSLYDLMDQTKQI